MIQGRCIGRGVEIGVCAVVTLLWTGAASSAPRRAKADPACAVAYRSAQKLERRAHLRQAQRMLAACAKATCDGLLRQQCSARFARLEEDIPSIVPLAKDHAGTPIFDVRVTMDGELLTSRIDGRALSIDPGLHQFSFEAEGSSFSTQLVIVQGQRNRSVTVDLKESAPPERQPAAGTVAQVAMVSGTGNAPQAVESGVLVSEETEPERAASTLTAVARPRKESSGRSLVAPYVFTGLGVLGAGGYALLTYWGRQDNDALSKCKPDCPSASVEQIRKLYLGANVSLGVGVVALGAATWLFLRPDSSTEERSAKSRYVLGVQPTRSGGVAALSGSF
jgi:hypothetical protein